MNENPQKLAGFPFFLLNQFTIHYSIYHPVLTYVTTEWHKFNVLDRERLRQKLNNTGSALLVDILLPHYLRSMDTSESMHVDLQMHDLAWIIIGEKHACMGFIPCTIYKLYMFDGRLIIHIIFQVYQASFLWLNGYWSRQCFLWVRFQAPQKVHVASSLSVKPSPRK